MRNFGSTLRWTWPNRNPLVCRQQGWISQISPHLYICLLICLFILGSVLRSTIDTECFSLLFSFFSLIQDTFSPSVISIKTIYTHLFSFSIFQPKEGNTLPKVKDTEKTLLHRDDNEKKTSLNETPYGNWRWI